MIIYDFEGTLRQRNSGERFADPYHAAIEIQVGSLTNHGRYLCYENGRVGVATVCRLIILSNLMLILTRPTGSLLLIFATLPG